jgi:hypothetical protein
MLSLFTLFLAMATMLGLWGLAWWLLKQPVTRVSVEPRPRQSQWRNEPTLGQGPAPATTHRPSEIPPEEPIPSPRIHDNSDSNTQFFSRPEIPRRAKVAEETEILVDQPPSTKRTVPVTNRYPKVVQAPPPAPPRKTQGFGEPGTSP